MVAADFQIGECFSLHNPGEASGWYMVVDMYHWENDDGTIWVTLECQSAEGIIKSKIRGDMRVLGRVDHATFVAAERRWEQRRKTYNKTEKAAAFLKEQGGVASALDRKNLKEGDVIRNIKTGDLMEYVDGNFRAVTKR